LLVLLGLLLLLLLSHGSGGRGEDAWELTVGACELVEGEVRIRNGCLEALAGGGRGAQRRRRRSAGVLIRTFSLRALTLAREAGAGFGGSWRNENEADLARVRRAMVQFQSELRGISGGAGAVSIPVSMECTRMEPGGRERFRRRSQVTEAWRPARSVECGEVAVDWMKRR